MAGSLVRSILRPRAGRLRPFLWPLLGALLAGLVLLVLPAGQIGLGKEQLRGLVGSYLYEVGEAVDRPVHNLRCTDLSLPKAVRIDWDYDSINGGSGTPKYEVQRRTGTSGSWTSFGTTLTDRFYVDTFSWTAGTSYYYRVRVAQDGNDPGLPSPPSGANPSDIVTWYYASGDPWRTIRVVPMEVTAADNQTVDSRYDLRYGSPTYLDFLFGDRQYRGGLYAGYAADPSRVGRSFMQFGFSSLPSSTYVWTANVHAYFLRSFADGSTTVGLQQVSDSWSGSTLKWSNAPSLSSAQGTVSCSYTGSSPAPAWKEWKLESQIAARVIGSGVFSAGMASTNEGTGGWAYFAKTEYDSSLGPRVLYAYGDGDSTDDLTLTLSPNSVTGGGSSTGTVTLVVCAPSGGRTVSLSDDSSSASEPSTVTVPAGSKSATFTITTSSVGSAIGVNITATYSSNSATALLNITP